jgi:hypothetical protein
MRMQLQLKKSDPAKKGNLNIRTMSTNAGSCRGVKYPCVYHCKKCIFDALYCNK